MANTLAQISLSQVMARIFTSLTIGNLPVLRAFEHDIAIVHLAGIEVGLGIFFAGDGEVESMGIFHVNSEQKKDPTFIISLKPTSKGELCIKMAGSLISDPLFASNIFQATSELLNRIEDAKKT